jgi:hypothetical protein
MSIKIPEFLQKPGALQTEQDRLLKNMTQAHIFYESFLNKQPSIQVLATLLKQLTLKLQQLMEQVAALTIKK